MSNEEIAVHLAAAVIQPCILLPNRRANVDLTDDQIHNAAVLAVKVYRSMLAAIEAEPTESVA